MRQAMMMGLALVAAVPAAAQTGAQSGTAMQPGAWGSQGWQAGAAAPAVTPAPASAPGYAAPAYAAAPAAPAYAPMQPYGASVWDDRRRPLERGRKLKGEWRSPRYTVADWGRYGLPAPGPGMRWIRYFDDAVLVDGRNRVVDARGSVDWTERNRAYAASARARATGPRPVPGVTRTVERTGPNTVVTTETRTEIVDTGYDAYAYGPGASFTPGTRTTVTTTTEQTAAPRRSRSRR